MSIVQLVILAIVVGAVIGIGLVAIRASGVQVPQWVIQILTILVVAVFAIFAIKILISMM